MVELIVAAFLFLAIGAAVVVAIALGRGEAVRSRICPRCGSSIDDQAPVMRLYRPDPPQNLSGTISRWNGGRDGQ